MKVRTGMCAAAMGLAAARAPGQASEAGPAPPAEPTVALSEEADTKAWEFSATFSLYVVPDDREYVQPTFTADHDRLHLEARYNYEDVDTASLWAGFNFGGGEEFTWQVTPMIGGVVGETNGAAPGYELSLRWWKFELYSEGEYVIDLDDSSDSFFYSWSELSLAPVEWFRFGIVAQRTRLYESDREVSVGPLLGLSFERVDLTAYALSPEDDNPTFVFTVGFSF